VKRVLENDVQDGEHVMPLKTESCEPKNLSVFPKMQFLSLFLSSFPILFPLLFFFSIISLVFPPLLKILLSQPAFSKILTGMIEGQVDFDILQSE